MKKFSKTFESIDDRKLEDDIRDFAQEFKDEGYSFRMTNESVTKIGKIKFYIDIERSQRDVDERFDTVFYQELLEQFLDRVLTDYPDLEYTIKTEMHFDKYHTHFSSGHKARLDILNYISTDIKFFNKGINYFPRD